jgi:hypothetical protein
LQVDSCHYYGGLLLKLFWFWKFLVLIYNQYLVFIRDTLGVATQRKATIKCEQSQLKHVRY